MKLKLKNYSIYKNGRYEYNIDNEKKSAKEYEEKLENLGIYIKARNFLVFQVLNYLKYKK